MEHDTKYSLSILRHPDSAPTHLIRCVSDLSSIRVVNSMCCRLSSSVHLCVWLCCVFESCVCCSPPLLLCFFCDHHCKGERLQIVEIPRKREKDYKEESRACLPACLLAGGWESYAAVHVHGHSLSLSLLGSYSLLPDMAMSSYGPRNSRPTATERRWSEPAALHTAHAHVRLVRRGLRAPPPVDCGQPLDGWCGARLVRCRPQTRATS
jgi:hypothetical protein